MNTTILKKTAYSIGTLLISLVALACNPLSVETPPVLAGDFSDPVYPKTYGKVTLGLDIDSDNKSENSTVYINNLILEFHFKTPDGSYILAKEYAQSSTMPEIVSFPIGEYLVVARSSVDSKEYYYGSTTMTVSEQSKVAPKIVCQLLADPFEDDIYPKTYGKVSVQLNVAADLTTYITKAPLVPNPKSMIAEFYYHTSSGKVLCKTYEPFGTMPAMVSFPVGEYDLVVKSHPQMPDVCDYAYFEGRTRFTVSENNPFSTTLKCLMQNTRLNVMQGSGLNNAFSSWNAKLKFEGESEYKADFSTANNNSTIFIKPAAFSIFFAAVQVGDNLPYSKTIVVPNVKPETDITITLTGQGKGNVTADIEITGNINRNDHDISFPDDEKELGGGGHNPNPNPNPNPDPDPEPEPDKTPTIIGDGSDIDNVITLSTERDFEGASLKNPLKIVATAEEGGLQMFKITIESDLIGSDLLDPLFGGKTFDLTDVPSGSELEKNLDALGILPKGTVVKGTKSFVFDLTEFMSLLPEYDKTHNFTLSIKDAKGVIVTKTVRILRVL